jgi:hypothetical protein
MKTCETRGGFAVTRRSATATVNAMNRRRIEALRNLAERPGTPEEGDIARKMLADEERRLQDRDPPAEFVQGGRFDDFARWLDEMVPKNAHQRRSGVTGR